MLVMIVVVVVARWLCVRQESASCWLMWRLRRSHMTTDPVVKSTVRRAIEVQTSRAAELSHKRKMEWIELARKKHCGDQICVNGNVIAHELFAAAAPDALDSADAK